MSYIPSVNIEHGITDDFHYIVTPNTKNVWGNIVSCYHEGMHSFTIIGTYGTGKSSFLAALQRDLIKHTSVLVENHKVFNTEKFEFFNVVGDYASLSSLLAVKLGLAEYATSDEVLTALSKKYDNAKKIGKFFLLVVDEFGKVLEHAAANNPEQELYFLQKLAEFINAPKRKAILLSTLHQNFSSYSYKLSDAQRNEWTKVKGRFKEIVFVEPIEQLLQLTASRLEKRVASPSESAYRNFTSLFNLAHRYKIVSPDLSFNDTSKLYPLDPISSVCLTLSMQRYGQNERTLFSFLNATDRYSLNAFKPEDNHTYSLAEVFDYITYSFYTYLSEANADSMNWRAIRVAIDRISSGIIEDHKDVESCLAIVKSIGLLSLFCKSITIDDDLLVPYAEKALGIENAEQYIKKLQALKIIRYAAYKSQYILFEGTDIDIEAELYHASSVVPRPLLSVENISEYVHQKAMLALASYYKTGTPRYFQFNISNTPITLDPKDDTDGYINLIFPNGASLNDVKQVSNGIGKAILYAYFRNTDDIIKHLHEIKKLKYLLEKVVFDDRVAANEVQNILNYESEQLNAALNDTLFDQKSVVWVYNAKQVEIKSHRDLNHRLSMICEEVYASTPILRNELFNRHKVNSVISAARVSLLNAILENADKEDLGFDKKAFPPEKSIYCTLLQQTGMHRKDEAGNYFLGEPQNDNVRALWEVCCDFVKGSMEKPRKLSELTSILKASPFKMKQGVIDFWIPIFLYIKQQDFALYEDGRFVININKEVFEILQKHPGDFSLKCYDVSGVKVDFFNKYRQFFHKDGNIQIQSSSLIGIAKPFFQYIRGLNDYAKITNKFDNPFTAKFRDLLINATDPQKTFLEDLPAAFGYKDLNKDEFLEQYLGLIKLACQELNNCYYNFICRIENAVTKHLGLPASYEEYKPLLDARYKNINKDILTAKTKSFLDRLLAPSENKTEFYAKIGLVIFDRRVENIRDSEEALFIKNMLHLFTELEHYTELSDAVLSSTDEAYNIDFVSTMGTNVSKKTFRLPESKRADANARAKQLSALLSGDNEMDICVLLKLLNDRIN